ncbi:unnamed protein product [Caenorhabditis nigoni]
MRRPPKLSERDSTLHQVLMNTHTASQLYRHLMGRALQHSEAATSADVFSNSSETTITTVLMMRPLRKK